MPALLTDLTASTVSFSFDGSASVFCSTLGLISGEDEAMAIVLL